MNNTTSLPVQPSHRADVLDILRGFALLGICLANYGYFSLYIFQKPETLSKMATPRLDEWLNYFHTAFIDGKFYTLFSFLFGIGFSIIVANTGKSGKNGLRVFYRRLLILLLFGLAHCLLIWDGDILFFYAVVGLLLPLFRNCSNKTLLVWAISLLLSPLLFDAVKIISLGELNLSKAAMQTAIALDNSSGIKETEIDRWLVSHTHYSDLLAWNRSGFFWGWQMRLDSNRIPKVLAMFLLGLYVGRNHVYSRLEQHKKLLKKVQLWGFLIGVPGGLAHAWFEADKVQLPKPGGLWDTLSYALNVAPLGLAYAATLALLYVSGNRGIKALAPVGRMALTNYIMQSVIGVALFFGVGAGLGGSVGRSQFMLICIGVFSMQVLYSHLWMRYFTYGPLEWIWRMLTYGKYLPIKKNEE